MTKFVKRMDWFPSIVSKAGAAHVVTSLTSQCPLDLQAFTGKLLSAFLSGLSDRNPAVRINYAGCIGHLVRTARDSSREKLFAKLKTWYMEKKDKASRAAVAFTYQAVTRHNPDVMKAFAASALPISFLAMHQEKTAASTDICSFPALHSEAEVRLAVLSPEEDRQVRLVMVHPEKEKGFDLVASIDDICNIAVKVREIF